MKAIMFFCGILIFTACENNDIANKNFKTVSGKNLSINAAMTSSRGCVLLFLSPECPLCQNYAVVIKQMIADNGEKNLPFLGVVSGDYYSQKIIKEYLKKYGLQLEIILDPEFLLAERFNAAITPEAILLNKDANILYQGAIDNWAISLGKKRLKTTAHYLDDAINNYLSGKKIDPARTKAVGCYIE